MQKISVILIGQNIDDLFIIICSRRYSEEMKEVLVSMSLIENKHFAEVLKY